jgi:hypothetical protein
MSKNPSGPRAPLTRKQLSRVERERRYRRLIWLGTAVVAALVLGLIGFGVADQTLLQPRQPVARVGQAEISTADFQRAVRFRRYQLLSYYQQVQQTALVFGSDPQTQQYFQSQLSQITSQLADLITLGREVLNELIDQELIRQEAQRRGLTVSAAEIDARLGEDVFRYFPNGTPTPTLTPSPFPTDVLPTVDPTRAALWTPTPTLTPTATLSPTATPTPGPSPTPTATFTPRPTSTPFTAEGYATESAQYFSSFQQIAGLNQNDLRRYFESLILREKLVAALSADVPASEEQVHARHILIGVSETATDEEKAAAQTTAQEVLARLNAGEDWSALAAQYSTDTSNNLNGGDLGWFGRGVMVAEFEQAAFAAAVGQITDPVQTSFGWHIIQVLGHENRALTASQLEAKRQQAFDAWLQQQRDNADASGLPLVEIFDRWQDRVPSQPDLSDLATVTQSVVP